MLVPVEVTAGGKARLRMQLARVVGGEQRIKAAAKPRNATLHLSLSSAVHLPQWRPHHPELLAGMTSRLLACPLCAADMLTDTAVLELAVPRRMERHLHPATLGSSSVLAVGEPVYLIGHPYGLSE